jgi:hypothetical protein
MLSLTPLVKSGYNVRVTQCTVSKYGALFFYEE